MFGVKSQKKSKKEEQKMSKQEISRRSFLKGTAAAGLGVAAAGLLNACGNNDTPAPAPTPDPAPTPTPKPTPEPEVETIEKGVTSVGDWKLWDEATGELNLEGRGANGANAVVAAGTPWAAQAGIDILQAGGNAVDAAAAVAFAISVTEPQASGIGGGGFMTIRDKSGSVKFINFREKAPKLATSDFWTIGPDGKVVGGANMTGGRAIGVPGTVAGMAYAVEKYGTMSLEETAAPAIKLCEEGFFIGPTTGSSLDDNYGTLLAYPEFGSVYLRPDGMNYTTGDLFKNTQQARALRLIANGGKDAFYKGELQEAMISTANKYGAIFIPEDFEEYEADEREAVHGTYRGYHIYSSPLPSSGGLCIVQLLNILENFDLKSLGHNSKEYIHLLCEAEKMVYSDRSKYVGADTEDSLVKALMSKEYAKMLADTIKMDEVHEPVAHDPHMYEHQDTTHFTVADKEGNIVAVTFTVNGYFGSKVVPSGYGFMMNNEMGDFSTNPESPNFIGPGKYPLSSMSPTVVCKEDGSPFMALGSPGATTIIVAVAQVIMNVIDFGMDIQEAVEAARFDDKAGKAINYESRIDPNVIKELEAMGHVFNDYGEWNRSTGSVQAVLYADDGTLHGGADPRRDNKALAF